MYVNKPSLLYLAFTASHPHEASNNFITSINQYNDPKTSKHTKQEAEKVKVVSASIMAGSARSMPYPSHEASHTRR
jgi:hypothetical protein